jgi:homoserine trans-succinylase
VLFLEKNEKHGAAMSWQSHAHLVTWNWKYFVVGVQNIIPN